MSEFELGIRRAVAIYNAGACGRSVPYYTGMRVADVEQLYSQGYVDAWAQIDEEMAVSPNVATLLTSLLTAEPAMAAALERYRAQS